MLISSDCVVSIVSLFIQHVNTNRIKHCLYSSNISVFLSIMKSMWADFLVIVSTIENHTQSIRDMIMPFIASLRWNGAFHSASNDLKTGHGDGEGRWSRGVGRDTTQLSPAQADRACCVGRQGVGDARGAATAVQGPKGGRPRIACTTTFKLCCKAHIGQGND